MIPPKHCNTNLSAANVDLEMNTYQLVLLNHSQYVHDVTQTSPTDLQTVRPSTVQSLTHSDVLNTEFEHSVINMAKILVNKHYIYTKKYYKQLNCAYMVSNGLK